MTSSRLQRDHAVPLAAFSDEELAAWSGLEAHAEAMLRQRTKEYALPEIQYQPGDDEVLIYRLRVQEKKTESGRLVLPDFTYVKEEVQENPWALPKMVNRAEGRLLHVALLLNAGLSARDWMRSHGYFLGDIVRFARWSGEEENLHWFLGTKGGGDVGLDVLTMNTMDMRGSLDLWHRLWGAEPTLRIVFASDGAAGMHIIKPIVKAKAKKKEK